jgi:hypothetical protein
LVTSIAQLRPRALEILLLHYKHGFGDAQIAALLGAPRGTITVTLSRLRGRLRPILRAAGRSREETTSASLRGLVDRLVPSPSYVELALSRDWVLQRLHALPRQLQQTRMEEIAAVIAWWRSGVPLAEGARRSALEAPMRKEA